MKKVLAVLLALAMIFSFAACGEKKEEPKQEEPKGRTEKLVLQFPEINAESDLACQFLVKFAEEVNQKTNGMIEIQVFGGGQLGNEGECIEGLRLGTYAFFRINPANLKNRGIDIPEYTALGLPFLLQSVKGGLNFLYSDYGTKLNDKIIEKSNGEIRGLANYICTPARDMFTKVECTSLADFKNLKVRSETSDIKIDMINCWASATPLAMSEIYSSLSTGVLDGCENTLSGMKNNNWYESCKYVLETEHVVGSSVILVSEKIWKELSEEEQGIVMTALKNACDWFQVETDKQIAENKTFLEGQGVKFTACTDKQAWLDSCNDLYAKYAADVASDFISTIQSYK